MSALFGTAVAVEAQKALASRVMISIAALVIGGISVLSAGMMLGAATGDEQILAKMGPLAGVGGWAELVGIVAQITAAGGVVAFGVALSWMFGREFADGTVAGLFALPVRRSTIALAKLTVYFVWAVGVAILLTAVVAVIGFASGYGSTDASGLGELVRIPVLVVLTALLCVPAAWIATLGRGLLPGIGATVVLVVIAQVFAVIGIGEWVPLVAPALWAITPDVVPVASLFLVPSVPLVFGALCGLAWARLQLDR
jgi:ABC-2 type transport system permease protein